MIGKLVAHKAPDFGLSEDREETEWNHDFRGGLRDMWRGSKESL
jgi:hypothetical protein